MGTLIIIVCFIAVVFFFSQEIGAKIKKIASIRGVTTFVPLAMASYIAYYEQPWILWILYYIHGRLLTILNTLIVLIPYKKQAPELAAILLLTLISVGPVALLNIHLYRKTNKHYAHPYWLSAFLWVITAILLLLL